MPKCLFVTNQILIDVSNLWCLFDFIISHNMSLFFWSTLVNQSEISETSLDNIQERFSTEMLEYL